MMHTGPKTIIITAFAPKSAAVGDNSSRINVAVNQKSAVLAPCIPSSFSSSVNCLKRHLTYSRMPLDSPYPSSLCDEDEDEDYDSDIDFQSPRKRERLTHLTPEEKLFRRKVKNRIAAQTARDRKKIQMNDLEERVMRLEAENDALKSQNTKLSNFTQKLSEENARLKIEHTLDSTNVSFQQSQVRSVLPSHLPISEDFIDSTTAAAVDVFTSDAFKMTPNDTTLTSIESAEFINDLQQQGQEIDATFLEVGQSKSKRPLILFMAVIAMMNCYSTGCETFSSKSFKEMYTKQMAIYGQMDPVDLVTEIRQEIKHMSISQNGKHLLAKKLEELLRSRKITRLKLD